MSKITSKIKGARRSANVGPTEVLKNYFKTQIGAQLASAGPPLGPILGKYGLHIANFCKDFNEQTSHFKKGLPLPVTVRINPDRTYKLEIGTPPTKFLLLQAAGIQEGREENETDYAGKITVKHAYEIAKIKHEDQYSTLQFLDLKEVVKNVVGNAVLLGIEVVKDLDPDEYQKFLEDRKITLEERRKLLEEEKKAKLNRIL